MKARKFRNLGYRGYIFSRKVDGNFIPQRVQNLVIKDYADRNNLFFKLSATEYKMDNSFLMLENVLKEIKKIEGMIFYSIFMLPKKNEKRENILKLFINNRKKLFFALEEFKLSNEKDLKKINAIFKIKNNTKNKS